MMKKAIKYEHFVLNKYFFQLVKRIFKKECILVQNFIIMHAVVKLKLASLKIVTVNVTFVFKRNYLSIYYNFSTLVYFSCIFYFIFVYGYNKQFVSIKPLIL